MFLPYIHYLCLIKMSKCLTTQKRTNDESKNNLYDLHYIWYIKFIIIALTLITPAKLNSLIYNATVLIQGHTAIGCQVIGVQSSHYQLL